jgi:PAS domain S-box-containing protein
MVAIAVLVAVVTAGSATFLVERERAQRLRELEGRATRIAGLLEQSLAQQLWNVDRKAIQRQLDVLAPNPELAEVTVTAVGYGTVATAGPQNVSDGTGGVVRVRPITYAQFEGFPPQMIGEVRVVLTRAEAEAALARARRAILAMAAAVMLALYAGTSVLLNRFLRTPITRLEAMVDRLATGDLDARCPVDSADELGRLAERVNVMADRLRGSTVHLRESETRFRTFVDHATDAFFLHDDQLTVVDVNRQACESLGYSREDLIGMHPRDFDVGLDEATVARLAERVGAGETVTFESLHRRKDGTVFPVEIRARQFPQGEHRFRYSLVRDITERKRAEAALRDSERRLEEAQRIAHVGYWDRDIVAGRITLSDEGARIFGLQPEERVGDLTVWEERWQALIHPEDRPRAAAATAAALAGGPRYDVEYRVVHRTGDVRIVHSQGDVIRDESGRPCRMFGIMQDITYRKRAEAELRESEERFRTLVQFSFDVYWETDTQHRFTRQEFADGLAEAPAPGSEIGKTRWGVPYLEPDEEAWRKHRATLDAHLPFRDFELARPAPDGSKRWVSVSGLPMFDSTGRFLGYRGVGRHITERKHAEAELRARQELLDLAQKAARAVAFDWYIGARETENHWSPELEAMYGLEPGTFDRTYRGWKALVHPDDWPAVKVAINRAHESGDVAAEYRVIHKDGTVHWLRAKGRMFFDAKGQPERIVGFMIDVTDWRRAEEALRESETRFRTFVDHAADAFFMLDFDRGTILDVNRCACESLGYTREELIGMTPLVFDVDLDPVTLDSIAKRAAAGETVVFARHRHRRKDGSVFPVEEQTSVFWHGGRRFLLKVARNISDRVQAEEERERLRQLEADLAHINRVSMLGELAASIAHEVNQPLAGVVSNGSACLRWLGGDVPNVEEAREAARRVVRDGKRAGELIARVRALTRRAATPTEKLDLNESIQEVLALVGDEAKRVSAIIRTQFADDCAPVAGDRVQLQQVVLNLVMNAIEAMSSVGGRARELLITTRNVDPDHVQVTVEDSGTGLDPNAMEKIFEPFYTTKAGGMGMGLSICRSIVQSHGGRLWATAKDGPGTAFHFALPKYPGDERDAGVEAL